MTEHTHPVQGPVSVERAFRVDGKRIVVRVVLPATIAGEIGMEAMMACARRILFEVESNEARVQQVKGPG